MREKLRIVVVGNGNAGAALVDSLLAKDRERVKITLYGDEEVGTYDRIGLDNIRAVVLDEESGEPERLRQRLKAEKAATSDPWLERRKNVTKNQFAREVNRI